MSWYLCDNSSILLLSILNINSAINVIIIKENSRHGWFWCLVCYLKLYFKNEQQSVQYGSQLIYNRQRVSEILKNYCQFINNNCEYTGNIRDEVKISELVCM